MVMDEKEEISFLLRGPHQLPMTSDVRGRTPGPSKCGPILKSAYIDSNQTQIESRWSILLSQCPFALHFH